MPSVIIFVLARHMEPQLVFGFWPPLLYFVFILLSTLRLDFWLSLWTGARRGRRSSSCWPLCCCRSSRLGDRPEAGADLPFQPQRHADAGRASSAAIVAGSAAPAVREFGRGRGGARPGHQPVRPACLAGRGRAAARIADDPPSEMRTVCVMFLDIRGFTAMTRTRSADETVALLNDFFAEMIEIVDRNHGIINKFLGDGFLALFGAALRRSRRRRPTRWPRGAACSRRSMRWNKARPQPGAARRHRHPYRRGGHRLDRLAAAQGVHRDRRHGEPRRAARAAHQGDRRAAAAVRAGARAPPAPSDAVDLGPLPIRGYDEPVRVWRLSELVLRLRLEHESRAAVATSG